MDPELQAGLETAGFVSFGFVEGGFADLMAGEPIRGVEDLKRRKVWVPEGDQIDFLAMQALGLSPVMLPITDVLTGLQTGLLDVVAASPVAALVLQWHTKVKYITDLPVSYSMGVFAIDRRTFMKLRPGDQQVFRDVMGRVVSDLDATSREDNREAKQALEDAGLDYVPVDKSDVRGWRQTIESIYPRLRQRSDVDGKVLDELLALLHRYRSGEAAAPSGD
jgi:TRAP-type C4-dicarboxylate transport system substrate-binding protein